MDVLLVLLVAGVVLLAELPDKSMFASLVLGSRFRPPYVFAGVAAAFVVHVVIAVSAGSLLRLLPHVVVESVVAALFLAGAAWLWLHRDDDEEDEQAAGDAEVGRIDAAPPPPGGAPPATATARRAALTAFGTSFGVIFVGEWGDITQVLTANLAARYHDPLAVGLGAVLGLWTAALLAITLGRTLLRYLSVPLLHRIGALVLLGFAVYTVVGIVRG